MTERYCELIKKGIDKNAFKRKQIIDELFEAKNEWNYPKVKALESQEKLIDSNIQQMIAIHNTLMIECPRDLCDFEIICEEKCKWYYDFLKNNNKI
jgi:hypothetical protein